MDSHSALVITSISAPTQGMRDYARGCQTRGARMIVIGDAASPPGFQIEGCEFYDLERQRATSFSTAALAPTRSYARKNIGYLLAMHGGAGCIVESDDDNLPLPEFWTPRSRNVLAPRIDAVGWVNIYRYFSAARIWPRGFPLGRINDATPPLDSLPVEEVFCPIQQSLADDDPDVDAIYRLVFPDLVQFARDRRFALTRNSWCPFNSQNTAWWPEAYALMYLPFSCSMRMTDIWRSFVAQRIAFENGWGVLFQSPTVRQERNPHDLLRDFQQETAGYLHNPSIVAQLENLALRSGADCIPDNLRLCYEELIRQGHLERGEMDLLDAWLEDCR